MSKRSQYFHDSSATKKPKNTNTNSQAARLTDNFFNKYSTDELAKRLLGKVLCRHVDGALMKATIVETEAYLGAEDHASYSFGGRRTDGNSPMYMCAGTTFTRFTYGMYYCFNISSRDEGGAVLLRAAEPIEGIEKMCQLRREHAKAPTKDRFDDKPFQLANGPSKLCIAFGIDSALNKKNILTDASIWIEDSEMEYKEDNIVKSTRVGIPPTNPWAAKLLRYYLKDFRSVSKK